MVSIGDCHSPDPGSIPGSWAFFINKNNYYKFNTF